SPCAARLFRKIFLVEGENLFPAVFRLLRAIARARDGEEAMGGAVVAVEFVILACFLQARFGLVDILGRGIFVVVAVNAEQRGGDLLRELDRRDRPLRWIVLVVGKLVAAPAVDDGVDIGQRAGT